MPCRGPPGTVSHPLPTTIRPRRLDHRPKGRARPATLRRRARLAASQPTPRDATSSAGSGARGEPGVPLPPPAAIPASSHSTACGKSSDAWKRPPDAGPLPENRRAVSTWPGADYSGSRPSPWIPVELPDWAAGRTDHPREVIEAALAHVVPKKARRMRGRICSSGGGFDGRLGEVCPRRVRPVRAAPGVPVQVA